MEECIFDFLHEHDALKLKNLGGIMTPTRPNVPPLFEVAMTAQHVESASHVVFGNPDFPVITATATQWQAASGVYFITVKETGDFLRVFLDRRHDLVGFLEELYVDAEQQIMEALMERAREDETLDEAVAAVAREASE